MSKMDVVQTAGDPIRDEDSESRAARSRIAVL